MYHKVYLFGYKGWLPQRWLRRLFAKSEFHRAWLAGHMGSFIEDDKHRGITDYECYRYRN